ncbi:Manganese transport system membrane protein MntB [Lacunisphaera limnophila]|uniref:Manganese transport system membrane protein MntB n=1 Tax=Lacunisphaera limnophila TaxID=1838286 RepID=A0A1D8ASE9_9BACT|nr:metal ABC transporter permease [Lacunisphaera limnophila]AOS43823.1 Manganese transport system membrane protein MntB [Lacunisphaera limnophila]
MSAVWNMLSEPWHYGFMQRGLGSALLLSVSGGMLGSVLVLRRMSLMGDALSHSLLPGLAASWFLLGRGPGALLLGALLAGLLTALGSALLSRLTRLKEDAAFGAFFLIAYAGGIALVSHAGTRVDLLHFLFGHVLGVAPADLWFTAGATALTVAGFGLFRRGIILEVFDPVFARTAGLGGGWFHLGFLALAVLNLVAALQTMGVILALGLFLLPAATAYLWCDRFGGMLGCSVGAGMVGSTVGLLLSYHTGLASGPAIVLCLGAGFLMSAVGSPRYGLLAALRRARHERHTVRHTTD